MASVSNIKKAQTETESKIHLTLQCKEESNSEDQKGFGTPAFDDGTLGDKQD